MKRWAVLGEGGEGDGADGLPHEIGEAGAAAVLAGLADAALGFAADIERAGMAEGLEKAVEEDLRLPLFIAGDVGTGPGGEGGEFFGAGVGHDARRLAGRRRRGKETVL